MPDAKPDWKDSIVGDIGLKDIALRSNGRLEVATKCAKHLAHLIREQRCCGFASTVSSMNIFYTSVFELLLDADLNRVVATPIPSDNGILCVVTGDDHGDHALIVDNDNPSQHGYLLRAVCTYSVNCARCLCAVHD